MADNESLAESEELDFDEEDDVQSQRQQNENDKYALTLQLARTPDQEDTFRPLLADAQKIGFFSLDRACQTTVTEIVEIKELTETVEQLLEDSATMRRDINFARSVMQAEFDAKLQKKALELYERVNEKIGEIERMHEDRVATVRRAFRQQLADALVRVKSLYNKNVEQKMKKERKRKDADVGKWEAKIKELQSTVQRNESVIHMLKMQLSQYQEKEEHLRRQLESLQKDDILEQDDDDWLDDMEEVASYKTRSSKTPSIHPAEEELEEVKEEVSRLGEQIERMQDALDIKEKDNEDLLKDIEELNQQLEKERVQIEQLLQEKNAMEANTEAEQKSAQNLEQALEQQRIAYEKELNERILQVREQALEEAKKDAANLQNTDAKTIKALQDEKRLLEQQLAKERTKKAVKSKEQIDLDRAKHKEQAMLDEISKLKKEIDRVHKTWEKKFAILQQSLHALKDESYLRQTMQKQAAQLHQASISYAADGPMGVLPVKAPQPMSPKKPLPHIQNKNRKSVSPTDYLSYTISAPSGRATTLFSTDAPVPEMSGESEGHVYPPREPPGTNEVLSYIPATTPTSNRSESSPPSLPADTPNPPNQFPAGFLLKENTNQFPTGCLQKENTMRSKGAESGIVFDYESAPSEYAPAASFVDENQVMSDGEQDLPEDIMPLPPPPEREDSRPSTRSHVVVMPHA